MSSLPVNLVVEFHLIWQTVNLKRNYSKKTLSIDYCIRLALQTRFKKSCFRNLKSLDY